MSFFYEGAYIEYKTNGHVQANSGHPGAPMVSPRFCSSNEVVAHQSVAYRVWPLLPTCSSPDL